MAQIINGRLLCGIIMLGSLRKPFKEMKTYLKNAPEKRFPPDLLRLYGGTATTAKEKRNTTNYYVQK